MLLSYAGHEAGLTDSIIPLRILLDESRTAAKTVAPAFEALSTASLVFSHGILNQPESCSRTVFQIASVAS